MRTKKGFILIYTILVGLVCLTIMMYVFDVQLSEMKYSTSNKNHVLKDDNYQRDKEYLMTLFFKYIKQNEIKISEVGVNKLLFNTLSSCVKYGKALVTYSDITNEFDFTTVYDQLNYRHDYYILEEIDEKFKLIFKRTEYLKK
ncbi:hypothetical protein [Clostridium sp.]|uniref:hypothetical protein n=1 Tax=Clostridium sp. TaxID=1506 RepID=UPI00262B1146|nr:hypothetical protein [uncultured Clostridium sp.]